MADHTKYSSLVNVPKSKFSTVAFLAIFQVAFIVLFGFFASIKVDKEKEEVPKLYSSIYSFYYYYCYYYHYINTLIFNFKTHF